MKLSRANRRSHRYRWLALRLCSSLWLRRAWLARRGFGPQQLRGKTFKQLDDIYMELTRDNTK